MKNKLNNRHGEYRSFRGGKTEREKEFSNPLLVQKNHNPKRKNASIPDVTKTTTSKDKGDTQQSD